VQPAEASRENATSSEALCASLIIGSWGIEFPNASNEEEEGQKDDHREDGFYDPIDLIEQDERSEDSNKEHSAWGRETSESGHCASVAGLRPNQSAPTFQSTPSPARSEHGSAFVEIGEGNN